MEIPRYILSETKKNGPIHITNAWVAKDGMPWTKTGSESIISGAIILYASKSLRAGVAAWAQKRHAAGAAVTKVINLAEWKPTKHIPNKYPYSGNDQKGSFADFYVYEKV